MQWRRRRRPDPAPGASPAPAQVDAVDRTADVVVLTMGGNDVGFGNIVLQCFFFRHGNGRGRVCRLGHPRGQPAAAAARGPHDGADPRCARGCDRTPPWCSAATRCLAPDRPLVESGGYDANRGVRALGNAGNALQQQVVDAVRASGPGRDRTYLDTSAATVFGGHEIGARTGAAGAVSAEPVLRRVRHQGWAAGGGLPPQRGRLAGLGRLAHRLPRHPHPVTSVPIPTSGHGCRTTAPKRASGAVPVAGSRG